MKNSEDPSNFEPFVPGNFLVGCHLQATPDPDFNDKNLTRMLLKLRRMPSTLHPGLNDIKVEFWSYMKVQMGFLELPSN